MRMSSSLTSGFKEFDSFFRKSLKFRCGRADDGQEAVRSRQVGYHHLRSRHLHIREAIRPARLMSA